MESQIIEQHEITFPHLSQQLQEMKILYNEKLWHQLTESILKYIKDPQVIAQGASIIPFYENFVKTFENKMDPIKYVRLISFVSDFFPTDEERITFVDKIISTKLTDEQAINILLLKKATYLLNQGKWDQTQQIIKDISKSLERCVDIDPLVYSALYKISYAYYKYKKNYEELYKNALQYLAYTNEEDMQLNEKLDLSLEMAQAVLISPRIYNFSELLQLPVLSSLANSKYQWVHQLLKTYNEGDVKTFQAQVQQFTNEINSNPLLKENLTTLEEKIRIMAFLELIFNLPKNDRQINFSNIASRTNVGINDVEYLVMRAMSLELVKGQIDQISQVVKINWIIPRVLDNARIQVMLNKFEEWHKSLTNLIHLIDSKQVIV